MDIHTFCFHIKLFRLIYLRKRKTILNIPSVKLYQDFSNGLFNYDLKLITLISYYEYNCSLQKKMFRHYYHCTIIWYVYILDEYSFFLFKIIFIVKQR